MSRSFFVRVCMFTVSNALLMSSATAMVRDGGQLQYRRHTEAESRSSIADIGYSATKKAI